MGRQFNRSWSDVLRSHHSNPYFSGSSIKGKYDFQNFDLSAALATLPIKNFTFGARLDYKVGDLSRLKDPRSRTNLADYQLTPAVTYTWNKHSLGLSGYYHRRKEKSLTSPPYKPIRTSNTTPSPEWKILMVPLVVTPVLNVNSSTMNLAVNCLINIKRTDSNTYHPFIRQRQRRRMGRHQIFTGKISHHHLQPAFYEPDQIRTHRTHHRHFH